MRLSSKEAKFWFEIRSVRLFIILLASQVPDAITLFPLFSLQNIALNVVPLFVLTISIGEFAV
jgi:hypothetical protein